MDYTSYALIEGRSEMVGYWAAADPQAVEAHKAVSRYIANFFAPFLMQDPESLAFLFARSQRGYSRLDHDARVSTRGTSFHYL